MASSLRREAVAVVALVLLAVGDCIVVREHWRPGTSQFRHPYRELVARATEWCYRKLVNDSSCCLDTKIPQGLRQRVVRRPGSEWDCALPNCRSELPGRRGDDYIWVSPEADCTSPRILYIHGGSWVYGSPTTSGYQEFTAKLADATGAMVMAVDYPLVSNRSSTTGQGNFDDIMSASIAALQWLASNGPTEDCPADSVAPLFIGGDSSGGGTGLSLAIKLGLEPSLLPGRRLAGAFLYSPWTNLMCNSPEYYHNAFAKIEENTYTRILMMRKRGLAKSDTEATNLTAYVGDVIFRSPPGETSTKFEMSAMGYTGDDSKMLTDPVASPYFADEPQLEGLPPLYIAVGSSESILGDSVVVAQNAAASGVDVHLDIHPGMWHVFPMYSEGCGGDTPLWNAVRAMNTTALFVRHLSETGEPPYTVSMKGPLDVANVLKQPHTTISYGPAVPSFEETDVDVGRHLTAVKEHQKQRRLQRMQRQATF